MSCEFLSGLTQPILTQQNIAIASGGNLPAGAIYLFLSARNRAGWTAASAGLLVNIPANSQITVTLDPANRGLGTDFIRYSLSANIANNAQGAVQIGEWENYLTDTYTRRTIDPIVLSRPEHLALAPSVATVNDLPVGADLINGMHRLVIGANPSSYYKYSAYTSPSWRKVNSPYTCQILDPYGTGGCAADVGSIDPDYLILPPAYDPLVADPIKGIPVKMVWHNNSPYDLPAGTEFAIAVNQGTRDRTDAFNGKLIVAFKGFTDGFGNLDRLSSNNSTTMPWVDGDRIWSADAAGILLLHKNLPPNECAVWEVAPFFTAAQFNGRLVAGEPVDIYLYPLSKSGKNTYNLWQLTGDLILPGGDGLVPTPNLGASIDIGAGTAIVKGYTFDNKLPSTVTGLAIDTAKQKICIDTNGAISKRVAPLNVEGVLAIVSTRSGLATIGQLSAPIAITSGANLTLTYPCDNLGLGTIRANYQSLGGKLGEFNPPFVRIWAKSGNNIYPAQVNGTNKIAIVPNSTQSIAIDSLGASVTMPVADPDADFGLYDPPTVAASANSSGTIAAGNYQFFAAYEYDGTTVSAIEYDAVNTIRATSLTFADLELLNQGWGKPVYSLADLRNIPRGDTFAWQHRVLAGGAIFYYDPSATGTDDGLTVIKPDYLTNSQAGRWAIRKSYSIEPAGIWNNTTTYKYLNLVTDNGSSYLYINPVSSAGNPLTALNYWQLQASKGDPGAAGATGAPGRVGAIIGASAPSTPAINASANYPVDTTDNLAIGQYYAIDGIAGTLLATGFPSSTSVTLQNIDATAAASVAANSKLVPTGKKGDVGAIGNVAPKTVGINPPIPATNSTADYTLDTIAPIAIGHTYGFANIPGVLLATATPSSSTVRLQNIDSVAGTSVPAGIKLAPVGLKGDPGVAGSPFNPRGVYSSNTTYDRYDFVIAADGASYWWANIASGNSAPPSSDWQKSSERGLPGTAGQATLSDGDYGDINVSNSGTVLSIDSKVVDFGKIQDIGSSRLLGRASAGSGAIEQISIGSGLNLANNTLSATNSGGGGGLSPWQLKTANYTAVAGDRLNLDPSAGDIVITLPSNPSVSDIDIDWGRIALANNVLIRSGSNPLNGQSGKDGVFNPSRIDITEGVRWVGGTVGWLAKHGTLTYQNAPVAPPSGAATVLLHFEGTTIVDSAIPPQSISLAGSAALSTARSKFGTSSLGLAGGGSANRLVIGSSPAIQLAALDFGLDFWAYLIGTNYILGKGDEATAAGSSLAWSIPLGACTFYTDTGIYQLATIAPPLNQWAHLAITRQGNLLRYFIDGVLQASAAISGSINNNAYPLCVGGYATGSIIGNIDEFRLVVGSCPFSANFTPPSSPY